MAISSFYRLVLLLSSFASVWAVPTPVGELAPRACTTANVNNISKLSKATPNDPFNSSLFKLHRNGGANSNTIKSVVTFTDIPQGATGCMLQIDLPQLPTQSIPTPIASGSSQSDVWLIKNPAQANPADYGYIYQYTWNKPPIKDQFVSTTIFPTSSPSDAYKTYMWSGTCKQVMSFQFELSDWQQGSGDVNFYNFFGGKYTPIGFQLVYNC
jgi:hypothetical protein